MLFARRVVASMESRMMIPALAGWMLGVSLFLTGLSGRCGAAEAELDSGPLPRYAPLEPAQALASFRIKPGFRVELAAVEPQVCSPVEICFDESGRMFVVEMIDYSELRHRRPHLGRVRMLEDLDDDGRFEKSTVFADDLPFPTGAIWANGGLYVLATPDLFFFKDTDGDGRADQKRVALTGFASEYAPYRADQLNMQALANSLRWGLDNRIHGAGSLSGGNLTSPLAGQANPVSLRGRDFAFDPRSHRVESEPGGGQYGLAFDDLGRRFTSNNSDHLRLFVYDPADLRPDAASGFPPPLQSIAADGPAAEVFRLSPDEPWRLVRTRWRVGGAVSGPIEGGGRSSGYFTSATGLMIYRGDAWPAEYRGDAFVADCGSNLVHRKRLRPDGVALRGERAADEQATEFLASSDTWFRPVQMANGPSGALYVVDMYREVIEHPWSIPPGLKKHIDLNSGSDRGRIYRIVPENFRRPQREPLAGATTDRLVRALEHPNGWHRDTAARLLYERQDPAAGPSLERLVVESNFPVARWHALHALQGLGALRPTLIERAGRDPDAGVREHAVRLAGRVFPVTTESGLPPLLLTLAADPSPRVRFHAVLVLGRLRPEGWLDALESAARRDQADLWLRSAVLHAVSDHALELFRRLTHSTVSGEGRSEPPHLFLGALTEQIGARNRPDEIAEVLAALEKNAHEPAAFALVRGLGTGLRRAGGRWPEQRLSAAIQGAVLRVKDASQSETVRVECAQLLGLTSYAEAGGTLLEVLRAGEPLAVQRAALRALESFPDPAVGVALVERWSSLGPSLRPEAVAALLARRERLDPLLDALEAGTLRQADLMSTQIDALANHRDPAVRRRSVEIFTRTVGPSRREVLDAFREALVLPGDAKAGERIYAERCASCHRLAGQGAAVGPDLVSVRNMEPERLLIAILDPNREVSPQYRVFSVETRDGESRLGILVGETGGEVTLRLASGRDEIIPRSRIASLRGQSVSLMPENLESGLSARDLAGLLAFIRGANP